MTIRNLSPQKMFAEYAKSHKPLHTFAGKGKSYFTKWKNEALPEVLKTLGDFPEKVAPKSELIAEWEHNGLKKQRWIINVQNSLSAILLINIPLDLKKGEKRPAILCCHGHGVTGKEPVMGNDSRPDLRESIAKANYNYGEVMAQKGFVTFAIDWIGFGERNDAQKPNHLNMAGGRDWCNLYYLHATMLGMTSLSINVSHGMAAIDVLAGKSFVDKDNIGVMGLSGGGTMSLWMTLCDKRIKATEIICYSDLWEAFGIRDINYCGMQVAPGLFKLVNLPELQGLIAPRPLLVDIGANDSCFKVDTAMQCYKRVEKIYTAAGKKELLKLDLHNGEHGWGGNHSESFFGNHLGLKVGSSK